MARLDLDSGIELIYAAEAIDAGQILPAVIRRAEPHLTRRAS
jgi:hypothetical protein